MKNNPVSKALVIGSIALVLLLVAFLGIFLYYIRTSYERFPTALEGNILRSDMASSTPQMAPAFQTTTVASATANSVSIAPATPGVGSPITMIQPSGDAALELGAAGSQFKLQFAAVMTVPSPGCTANLGPSFSRYFNNEQTNSSWCYTQIAADNSGRLTAISLSVELYGSFPEFSMTYPVTDPDNGAVDQIAASTLLPGAGGTVQFTPVGSIHPTGRVVFVVPTEATETIVSYPGGEFAIDLTNDTIALDPGSLTGTQTSTIVTSSPVSIYGTPSTYTDPSGIYSIQFPSQFQADNSVSGSGGNYLDNELVSIYPSESSAAFKISPLVNGSISSFDVEYSNPSDAPSCENPNDAAPDGMVPPTIINGVDWYKYTDVPTSYASQPAERTAYDAYQTYLDGTCWGIDFTWTASNAQPPNYAAVNIFEEAILGTFHVLDPSGVESTTYQNGD